MNDKGVCPYCEGINKKCTRCEIEKCLSEYYKDKRATDGCTSECKLCHNVDMRKWNAVHTDYLKRHGKEWYAANTEKAIENKKIWNATHPERARAIDRKSSNKRRSTPKGKLTFNMRAAVWRSIKIGSKSNHRLEELLGYTIAQLKKYLEKRFKIGMTWENYGTTWEIDHKIPISVFNFERPEDIDFRLCWSLKNLQPLNAKENHRKQAKIAKPFQPALMIGGNFGR